MEQNRYRLGLFIIAAAGLLLLPVHVPSQAGPAAQPASLAITHVTLIDVTGAPSRADYTVVIAGNRIRQVGPASTVKVPRGTHVVDGTGKFLIPGLWDAHIHWLQKNLVSLFPANGVTGVRVMWGSPYHREWAKEAEAGTLVGPRIYMAGSIVDGKPPIMPSSTGVASEAEARQAVRDTRAMGADFVKVYSRLSRAEFLVIADEARKLGLPFAGHVPGSVSAGEASDAGQQTIEHLTGILSSASSRPEELEKLSGDVMTNPAARREVMRVTIDTFDPVRAEALFARFRKNGSWQSPTLVVLRNIAYLGDPSITNDDRTKYMPASIRNSWNPANDFRFRNRTPEDAAIGQKYYAKNKELVGMMNRAGVGILAGTDVLNPFCFPGFSLHDELVLLGEAGLTPLQALQAATLNVAKLMKREADLGSVAAGKLADLVLLDADPLTDIRNTRRIRAVVLNGRLLDRAALDQLLQEAEAIAAKPPSASP